MSVDHSSLDPLRSFEDGRLGIRERFLDVDLGGRRSLAVLSEPLSPGGRESRPAAIGWLICHSLGAEQINLQPLEVATARGLAARGFPVLRYHGQGYGDSVGATDEVSVQTHLQDAYAATLALTEVTAVGAVGLIGGRFGGTVAAMTAARVGAPAIALWEPVVSGDRYLQSLIRAGLAIQLTGPGRSLGSSRDPVHILRETGVLELQGFPLRTPVFDAISSLDVCEEIAGFRGEALILQVSRFGNPRSDLLRLCQRIRDLEGAASLEFVVEPEGPMFGQQRYRATDEGGKEDSQRSLSHSIADRTVSWCSTVGLAASASEDARGSR